MFEADFHISKANNCEDPKKDDKIESKYSLTKVGEVFKLRIIYVAWAILALDYLVVHIVNPLHKSFGQSFVADDHLLALAGSLSAVCQCVGRVLWGRLFDRLGSKVCFDLIPFYNKKI